MVSAGRILLLVMASDASKLFYIPSHLWCFLLLAMFKNSISILPILFCPFYSFYYPLYRVCSYTYITIHTMYYVTQYPIGSRNQVGPKSAEPIKPHGENVINLCEYAYAVLPLYPFITYYYSCSLLQSIYTRMHYSHLLINMIKQMKKDINRWNKPVPTLIHRGVSKRVTDGVVAT